MVNRLKCEECNREFTIKKGDILKCPACSSVHVTSQTHSLVGKYWWAFLLTTIVIVALVLFFAVYNQTDCVPPIVKNVEVDTLKRTITISVISASKSCHLLYSIDNNKTTASEKPEFSDVPPGKYHVCVIYGDKTEERVFWRNNPVIMPGELNQAVNFAPPQITGVDIINSSCSQKGKIIVHAESENPILYILNDSIIQQDSVFKNLSAGAYTLAIKDSTGRMDRYMDRIVLRARSKENASVDTPCQKISKGKLQDLINNLFSLQRGDNKLQNIILSHFESGNISVAGVLVNTTQKYSIYQYMFRQNIGLPGSIMVEVEDVRYNDDCKINYIKIKEYEAQ